jgi:hypothetical protein
MLIVFTYPNSIITTTAYLILVHWTVLLLQVFLALKDDDLTELSDFNILLANTGVPLYREGLNNLLHAMSVSRQNKRNKAYLFILYFHVSSTNFTSTFHGTGS